MNIEEHKTFIQRQIMELVIDIQILRSKKLFVDYDVSADGQRLFVHMMQRDAPMMAFDEHNDWLLDFGDNYDPQAVNDCLTSLACVLSDLEVAA
jgi:hypothetical protein